MDPEVKGGSEATGGGGAWDSPTGDRDWDYREPPPRALKPVGSIRPIPVEHDQDYEEPQPRAQGRGITTRQAVFLIVVNAWISLLITLSVVFVVEWVRNRRGPVAVGAGQATATPTVQVGAATPIPTSGGGAVTYVVKKGDTLSSIAYEFDVLAEDIMRANGITDANLIYEGQELIIPVGGLPTDIPPSPTSPPPVVVDTPTTGPVASPVPAGQVRISDVLGRGELAAEMVVILNGDRPIRLKDWTLSDAQGHTFTFPDLFLGAGGSVRVHTTTGQNSVTDLYWGQSAAVWAEPGDEATLRDANGVVVYTYQLP